MAYTKSRADWVDGEAGGTRIDAANLDTIEEGIYQAHVTADGAIPKTLIDAKGDLIVGTAADAAGRLAVGTDGQILTADAASAGGVKWAAGGGSSTSGLMLPGYLKIRSTKFAHPYGNMGITANGWTTYGIMRLVPLRLALGNTFDGACVTVGTAAAGAYVRLGLYAANTTTGSPDGLLYDWGQADASTTGDKVITIDVTLSAGLYWMTAVLQGSVGAKISASEFGNAAATPTHPAAFGEHSLGKYGVVWPQISNVTGAFPDPLGTPTFQDQGAPFIALKAA